MKSYFDYRAAPNNHGMDRYRLTDILSRYSLTDTFGFTIFSSGYGQKGSNTHVFSRTRYSCCRGISLHFAQDRKGIRFLSEIHWCARSVPHQLQGRVPPYISYNQNSNNHYSNPQ